MIFARETISILIPHHRFWVPLGHSGELYDNFGKSVQPLAWLGRFKYCHTPTRARASSGRLVTDAGAHSAADEDGSRSR